ncbi:MAG: hypothetical protein P3X22_000825 [Thermoprotei archaeon]|nr:hypothetical protein [Thermoprotei archaeon]
MIIGVSGIAATWAYYEALLASTLTGGLKEGVYAAALGAFGVSVAGLSRIFLLKSQAFESRRLALTLAVVFSLASLAPKVLLEGPLGALLSYISASAAYGLASATAFSTILYDVDYGEWRRALVGIASVTSALTLLLIIVWSTLKIDLTTPLTIGFSTITLASTLKIRKQLVPSLTLKNLEILSDIIAFKRNPETYKQWELETLKLTLLLGALGALKITVLVKAVPEHGILNCLAAYSAGALTATILANKTIKPRISAILVLATLTITLAVENTLAKLPLIALTITYTSLTVTVETLENKPKTINKIMTAAAITTTAGATITGALSLLKIKQATIITIIITTAIIITAIIESKKKKWE